MKPRTPAPARFRLLPLVRPVLQAIAPVLPPVRAAEALRGAAGVMLGLAFTHSVLWAIFWLTGSADAGFWTHPLLIAPFGASAVLIYGVPTSPLAQPWSVVAGNTVAALCALMVLQAGLQPLVTLSLAAVIAMAAMSFARALHPPGGAVAVATVMAASPGHMPGLTYVLVTVFLGSVLLVAFGVAFNRATARSYPFRPVGAFANGATAAATAPGQRQAPTPLALAAALDRLRLGANLGVDDLAHLIETAETMTVSQSVGLTAARIMTADPVTVSPQADWRTLSALFVQHGFRSLPVVDDLDRFLGLIPVQAVLRPGAQGLSARHLLEPTAALPPEATLADLLQPLAQGRQIAVPVVDAAGILTGIVTRSDIVAALVHAMAHP